MEPKLPTVQDLPSLVYFDRFYNFVGTTMEGDQDAQDRREHWVLGLCEEAGEVAGWLKKRCYRSAPHPKHLLLEEVGGLLWYAVAAAREAGLDIAPISYIDWEKCDTPFSATMRLKQAASIYADELLDFDYTVDEFLFDAYCTLFACAEDLLAMYGYTLPDAYHYNLVQLSLRTGQATCTEEEFAYYNVKKVRKQW